MRLDRKIYNVGTNKNIDVKIVQISDIHFSIDYNVKRLERLRDDIDQIVPDYVCIVGDLIDEYDVIYTDFIKIFKKWLRDLSLSYKVIISFGNHDLIVKENGVYREYINHDWLYNIKSSNLIILNNEVYSENGINFIGYNPGFKYYYNCGKYDINSYNSELSKLISNNNYNILLIHTPFFITKNDNYKNISNFRFVDLILSGHTHGGLIPSFFPGHFGFISPKKKLFPKCVRGRIKNNNFDLIISSGVVKLSRKSKLTRYNDIFCYNINVINIKKI